MEHAIYFWSALVGCTLLLVQVVLQVFGLGGDGDGGGSDATTHGDSHAGGHDPAHGTSGNIFFGLLSFKALVSFVGIFGLVGLALERQDLPAIQRIGIAVLAGFLAMLMVAWLMRLLHSVGSSGTIVVGNAVGHTGEVYLRIPGAGAGRGKVTLELQGRTVELVAVTDGEALATGRTVRVLEVLGGETLKVEAV